MMPGPGGWLLLLATHSVAWQGVAGPQSASLVHASSLSTGAGSWQRKMPGMDPDEAAEALGGGGSFTGCCSLPVGMPPAEALLGPSGVTVTVGPPGAATGADAVAGSWEPRPFELVQAAPAASSTTTNDDATTTDLRRMGAPPARLAS